MTLMNKEEVEALRGHICAPKATDALVDTALALFDQLEKAREALAPFARIRPSSLYMADGSDHEPYGVIVDPNGLHDFTGLDLARARAAHEGKE